MKRSKFNLSYTRLLSCDLGELVPVGMTEVLPGDTVQHACSALVRAAPLLAPVMHPVHVRIHNWFVPYRIIWDDFEDFITGGPDGNNTSVYPTRTTTSNNTVGALPDYLGIPPLDYSAQSLEYSALPFRAYQLIWNEFYRDQDLDTPAAISTASGADNTTSGTLQTVRWEKDYFTSARPWEQKGPAITIPLGTSAPVVSAGDGLPEFQTAGDGTFNLETRTSGSTGIDKTGANANPGAQTLEWSDPKLEADLTGASAVTVNLLREALALQRFEEARARYGSRYVEYLRYLGVRSSDARLQRPEYLGGVHQTIQFSEVLATANTAGNPVIGEMYGHGIAGLRSRRYRRFFEEHGIVLSLLSVRPKTMYQNGLERLWNRRTKEDFFQKELQHIGQQEVLNKEVYTRDTDQDGVFGYQDRYDEYRRSWSSVHGEFRTTLDYWHFARQITSDPALNATFVACVPREDAFAVPAEDTLYVMVRHNMVARRLLAKTGASFIF